MAQERRNFLSEWVLLFRKQIPELRRRFQEWLTAVREEPALIWQTTAVRYVVYGITALLLSWGASCASRMLIAPPPPGAKASATTADFHVVCSNRGCGHHFMIHRKFGFGGFPVACPKCQQKSGERAIRCTSSICDRTWVRPEQREGGLFCPVCGRRLEGG